MKNLHQYDGQSRAIWDLRDNQRKVGGNAGRNRCISNGEQGYKARIVISY